VSVSKFTTQLANSMEFVSVGTVWLSSRTSPKEFHAWDLCTVSTVRHPFSGAQGICLSLYKAFLWCQKAWGITKDVGEN
jgi:hypothetical protein